MDKKKNSDPLVTRTEKLRDIVGELTEVHGLLDLLCTQLEGGGIVQAKELEPVVAEAAPKLRKALNEMNTLTHQGGARVEGRRNQSPRSKNPLLM